MSERTLTRLKALGGWIAFIAVCGWLLSSPSIWLRAHGGVPEGRQLACGPTTGYERDVDIEGLIGHAEYWRFQPVTVEGALSYDPAQETFYLRDGALSVPLDVSDCQGLKPFMTGETFAVIKGTVALTGDGPSLEVSELRAAAPPSVQVFYDAGIIGVVFILLAMVGGMLRLFVWLLGLIGIFKKKPALTSDELRDKKAGGLLLAGIFAPLVYLINPVFGVITGIALMADGWQGLRSRKRGIAIAGLVLCAAGLIIMPIVSAGFGWFKKPRTDFYLKATETGAGQTGFDGLESKAYVNDKAAFSIHQPEGWSVDAKPTPEALITINGFENGTFQGKPFKPQFKIDIIPLAALKATDAASAAKAIATAAAQDDKDLALVTEDHTLAGGRLDAKFIDATYTDKGVPIHVLALIAAKNQAAYIVGSDMPVEKWTGYANIIRASLMTFKAWDATFAACLKSKGAVFYGASTCEACNAQKALFSGGIDRLPYVECNSEDGKSQLDVCKSQNIKAYPTWEFADGSRLVGQQALQTLAQKTGCPLSK